MKKILHVLDHSLPYFSGYSFRSDYIIRSQRKLGLEPVVLTSPKHEEFSNEIERIDGVDYYRLKWPGIAAAPRFSEKLQASPLVRQMATVAALSKEMARLAGHLGIELIHAHSPSLNGLAAARAAQSLGLPWVYELRYYDEDAAVDRGKIRRNSLRYRMSQRLEQSALEQAHRVIAISSALRTNLIERGIPADKIFLAPNGVDTEVFQPLEPDAELVARYGLKGKTVIGFIGSFYFYEGLKYLIEAGSILLAERREAALLLVGEGEAEEDLRAIVPPHLRERVIFTGKIPHEQAPRYYSVMEIAVYPRVKSRLTELTTPLKPLEAMAMGRVVVGSRVGGISELVRDGETGFLVEPESSEALAESLARLIDDHGLRAAAGRAAREFVVRERDWRRIVECYPEIYRIPDQGNF